MESYKLTPFLLLLAVFARPGAAADCTNFTAVPGCACTAFAGTENVAVSCGSEVSIVDVTGELRAAGVEWRVTQMSILTSTDTLLPSNTFQGFTSLEILAITVNVLSVIEPGAFTGLSSIEVLDLRSNNLEWLSGEILTGISTLSTLRVDNNQIQYLSSDLLPIISNISLFTLAGNLLECDCHLQWFVDFVATHSDSVFGAMCFNGGSFVPLDDPSVDFAQCQDLCTLGYNFCHENSTCIPGTDRDNFSCTCNDGLQGDGIECYTASPLPPVSSPPPPVCDLPCGVNEQCVFGSTQYQQCICDMDFVLDGDTCIPRVTSHIVCSGGTFQDYVWPNITAGSTATLECATVDSVTISRECQSDGSWGAVLAPDCLSAQVLELREQLDLLTDDSSSDPLLTDFSSQLLEVSMDLSFSGDIPELVDILQEAIDLLENVEIPDGEIPTSFEDLVMVGSELLEEDSHPQWQQLSDPQVADNLVGLFGSMNDLGTIILAHTDEMMVTISSNNIALVVIRPFNSSDGSCTEENVTISSSSLLNSTSEDLPSTLQLPPSILNDTLGHGYECSSVGIVAVVYDNTGGLIAQSESIEVPVDRCGVQPRQVNSVIISASVVNSSETVNSTQLSTPIIITLQHDNASLEGPVCAFINEDELLEQENVDGSWLTQGCSVLSRMDDQTVCQCFHLTSFALLMSPRGPRTAPNLPLQIASKVGLSLSIICLIITIVLLFSLKLDSKSNKLHKIHRQLALALCLSQVIFLVAVDRTLVPSPDWLCTTIAALLHYFLLCTFAWQLIEGVHLYLMVVKVFYNRKVEWVYYPFAWGAPLIIVGVTVGVRFCDYTSEFYCWITIVRGTIWAFLGPVIAVLAINTVIMIIVIIFIIVKAAKKREENACVFFTLIHASLVLVPILGITWILGFFVVGEGLASTIIEWLFFFFTTLQGVAIFVMHCVLKREVRAAFLKAIGCHEQAKKQRTVMEGTRRMSRVNTSSIQQLAKSFTSRNRKTSIPEDITTFQPRQESSGVLSETFEITRPMETKNPLFSWSYIKEESETPPSSAPPTPNPAPRDITQLS